MTLKHIVLIKFLQFSEMKFQLQSELAGNFKNLLLIKTVNLPTVAWSVTLSFKLGTFDKMDAFIFVVSIAKNS